MTTQLSMFDSPKPAPVKALRDITSNRHGGNERSVDANERVNEYKSSTAERIRLFVAGCGDKGATLADAVRVMWHPAKRRAYYPNELSGRFSELSADKKIFDSGRVRENHTVWVADRRFVNGSAK